MLMKSSNRTKKKDKFDYVRLIKHVFIRTKKDWPGNYNVTYQNFAYFRPETVPNQNDNISHDT